MDGPARRDSGVRLGHFLAPAVPVATFVALLAWTWGKWPEAFVDFGRELYVPWCLSEGKRLYRDVAYFNGPLSPWTNYALFRSFGASLRTLALANVAITALVGIVTWRAVRIFGDRVTAAVATCVFLVFFAFGQFMPGGAYNFVAPYSHEMTHGTLLAGSALLLVALHVTRGATWPAPASGICLGLAFLTKPEFAVAGGVAVVAGFALHHALHGTPRREVFRVAALLVAGAALPPVGALLLLLPGRTPAEAVRGVLGTWVYVFDERITGMRFYRDLRGTSDVAGSLVTILGWTAREAAVLVPSAGAALLLGRARRSGALVAAALAPAAAAVTLIGWRERAWEDITRPLPFLLLAALIPTAAAMVRTRRVLPFAFLVYAVLLPLKVWLNLRTLHYGFALALPAAVAAVVVLFEEAAGRIARRGGSRLAFRAAVAGALAAVAFVHLEASAWWLDRKTVPLGSGADAFLADAREKRVADLVDRVATLRAPGETLVMLPEGVMVNYLTRAEDPVRYFSFTPPELLMYGEADMVATLEGDPPDWVVLVHRSFKEYGYRVFGDDYAPRLAAWLGAHYDPVDSVLEETARGRSREYALILRRKPSLHQGRLGRDLDVDEHPDDVLDLDEARRDER